MAEKANNNIEKDIFNIDFKHIARYLLRFWFIIVISAFLFGIAGFVYSKVIMKPTYTSVSMFYVYGKSAKPGDSGTSISSSDLITAQRLAQTYSVLLKNDTTLAAIIEKYNLNYSCDALNRMISVDQKNSTEIIEVTVTANDPEDSAKIAEGIVEVFPEKISEIIEGANMKVVQAPDPLGREKLPDVTRVTLVFLLIGLLISASGIVLVAMFDNTIRSDDFIRNACDYPILAGISNLTDTNERKYGYYSGYGHADKKGGN